VGHVSNVPKKRHVGNVPHNSCPFPRLFLIYLIAQPVRRKKAPGTNRSEDVRPSEVEGPSSGLNP
jgi:hypothetical protein